MRLRTPLRNGAAATLSVIASLAWTMAPLGAQQRDARIPAPGNLWLEISPILENWTEQFAKNSPDVADGSKEPLFAHFDGPIADRLTPGPLPFIEDLNRDADVLGFDPITETEFSMGRIDYQTINAQRRTLAAGLEVGVFKRIAIGVRVPFTKTDLEPALTFDSLSASVMGALSTFPPGDPYFSDARSAIDDLDALIASGSLMGQELDDAIQLRTDSDAFVSALQLRAGGELLVPTGLSKAGTQMNARYDGFMADFDSLGLALPELTLLDVATAGDLQRFLEDSPLSGMVPERASSGLSMAEFEVSARFGLLDQITPRYAASQPETVPVGVTVPPAADSTVADPAAADSVATDPAITDSPPVVTTPVQGPKKTVRLRTTVGALMRIPRAVNGVFPMYDPSRYMNLPVSDGQTDLEFSLYQDVALGDWFMLRGVGRYGIQMADQLVMRISEPDQPYAFESTEAAVDRDLGDYTQIILRPSIRFNSAIWIGLEYDYWRLGDTKYSAIPIPQSDPEDPPPEVPDASPLEVETSQTRHMVGIGITYDLSEARSRADVLEDRSPVRSPWQFTMSLRKSVAGSGGQTAAPLRYSAAFRIPIAVF